MSTSLVLERLNPAFINMLCEVISHGNYPEVACRLLGIQESTFQAWMRIGKRSESGIHRELYERVLQADAACEAYVVEKWRGHLDRDVKGPRDFLARRFPDRWGERRYIRLAVDREIEQMIKDLQQRLPEDIFLLVMNELAVIDQERSSIELDEG